MLVVVLVAMSLVAKIVISIAQAAFPANRGKKAFRYLSFLVQAVIVALAVFFGVLLAFPEVRQFIFFKFAMGALMKDKPLDIARCEHFAGISGRVLEIGVGPGTNFRCWTNNTAISEWVGVEPNTNFIDALPAEISRRNISFPTRTVWLKGEDLDVEADSFDFVVGAHVLCSVDSTPDVLKQVARALKPGGKYLFFEHVAAEEGSRDYYLQLLLQPFVWTIGAGCQFKKLWRDVTDPVLLPGFQTQLSHVSMDMPAVMSILRPHIVGAATKPLLSR